MKKEPSMFDFYAIIPSFLDEETTDEKKKK